MENNPTEISSFQISSSQVSLPEPGYAQINFPQVSSSQISSREIGVFNSYPPQVSSSQIGTPEFSSTQISSFERGFSQIGTIQAGISQSSILQIGLPQDGTVKKELFQPGTAQVGTTQVNTIQVPSQLSPSKVSFSGSIPSEQLLSVYSGHNSTPASIYTINNSALALWNSLLSPTTPLNINLQLTDLPIGQLAEAVITQFDSLGRPNGGTLLIDTDANGIGWYIDPTPFDHSEFTTPLTDTAFRATTNSPAAGRYDLLTTLLHEMGHLAGFIDGYTGYDSHIQTVNGSPLFVGDNFSALLTPDGSHLDPKLYPYDLMNPTLTPGVRKLPSLLDLQILNAARSVGHWDSGTILHAPFESDPLIGILNGRFDEDNTTDLDYGWSTRGATTILDEEAVLNETSRLLSNFSQTFIVPEGAKYLKFTLRDTTLGNSPLDPPDAFEVALLDAHTQTSLVNTATGLTQTDAFLNIQHDGVAYYGSQVILPSNATPSSPLPLHSPMIFKVDLSGITPGTVATLYWRGTAKNVGWVER